MKLMKTLFIICLRYAPGNWQHIRSFADCIKEKNSNIRFIMSKDLEWMNDEFFDLTDYLTSSKSLLSMFADILLFFLYKWYLYIRIFRKYKPNILLFVMWHPLNYFLSRIAKTIYPQSLVCFWMHEPYKIDKSYYKKKAVILKIIEYVQEIFLPLVDVVILHSNRALNGFKVRYPNYKGKVEVIPLLFKDECRKKSADSRSFDITYMGTAAKAKGIDEFFELAKENKKLHLGLKFQIITSSNIDAYLNKLDHGYDSFLKVINKPQLADEEIREACSKSFSVIAPYRETTQSGMIPVAFMCGTPVIGTDIEGLNDEYIVDKFNGILIPKNFSHDDVTSALMYIKTNFSELSKNARKSFEETWSDRNWDRHYGWLIERDKCNRTLEEINDESLL